MALPALLGTQTNPGITKPPVQVLSYLPDRVNNSTIALRRYRSEAPSFRTSFFTVEQHVIAAGAPCPVGFGNFPQV
jgi:hypothetical protein